MSHSPDYERDLKWKEMKSRTKGKEFKISSDLTVEVGGKTHRLIGYDIERTCDDCSLNGRCGYAADGEYVCRRVWNAASPKPSFGWDESTFIDVTSECEAEKYRRLFEEEHRKYANALAGARGLVDAVNEEGAELTKEDIKNLFPDEELEPADEDDDVKIPKFLKGYFGVLVDENSEWGLNKRSRDRIVAWVDRHTNCVSEADIAELLRAEYERGRADAMAGMPKTERTEREGSESGR